MLKKNRKQSQTSKMLKDLYSASLFIETIEATAPETCENWGGGKEILKLVPGRPCAAGFWSIDLRNHKDLWCEIAIEQQQQHRS